MPEIGSLPGTGMRNRRLVLVEIMRNPGVARTEIANTIGLNLASVSRITRDLIEAGLVQEAENFGQSDRPGRRFVGIVPRGDGGVVIGIGMNAFRQSITLANLENEKLDEWVADSDPGADGSAFLRTCFEIAAQMVARWAGGRTRFFGVGMAVAAELDKPAGKILSAPVFGWQDPVDARKLCRETLNAPLVLDAPSSAINKAEADCGLGRGVGNLATLHCSLGFGLGIRATGDDGHRVDEFGRVLTQARASDGSGLSLSELCGGVSILAELHGAERIAGLPAREQARMLSEALGRVPNDAELSGLLHRTGKKTAHQTALIFDLFRPERILLAGPLARAEPYFAGFCTALDGLLSAHARPPEILHSNMTPTGASRWLSLRSNVVAERPVTGRFANRSAA